VITMTTFYRGYREHGTARVVIDDKGRTRPLPKQLKLFNHSPTGFEWGYGGSGPAQLALAILVHALGDKDRALRLHQKFKWAVVARLPADGWMLTPEVVLARVQEIEQETAA